MNPNQKFYNPLLTEQKIINENNKQIVPKLRFDNSLISEQSQFVVASSTDIGNLPPISNSFSPVSVNYRDGGSFSREEEPTTTEASYKKKVSPGNAQYDDLQLELEMLDDPNRIKTGETFSPHAQNSDPVGLSISLSSKNQDNEPSPFQGQLAGIGDSIDLHLKMKQTASLNKQNSQSLIDVLNRKVVEKRSNSSHKKDREEEVQTEKQNEKPSAYYDIKKAKDMTKKPKTPNISFYKNKNAKSNEDQGQNSTTKITKTNNFDRYEIIPGPGPNPKKSLSEVIKPLKKNYYQKMSSSKFMKKYDEISGLKGKGQGEDQENREGDIGHREFKSKARK